VLHRNRGLCVRFVVEKANLTCLNRLNVAWVELHSETVFRMRTVNGGKFLVY
jgi:hypothetical protein